MKRISLLLLWSLMSIGAEPPCGTAGSNEMYGYHIEQKCKDCTGQEFADQIAKYYLSDIPSVVSWWLPMVYVFEDVYQASGLFAPKSEGDTTQFCEYVKRHPGVQYKEVNVKTNKINELNLTFGLKQIWLSDSGIQRFPSERELDRNCDRINQVFAKNKAGLAEFLSFGWEHFGEMNMASLRRDIENQNVSQLDFNPGRINFRFQNGTIRATYVTCRGSTMNLRSQVVSDPAKPATFLTFSHTSGHVFKGRVPQGAPKLPH